MQRNSHFSRKPAARLVLVPFVLLLLFALAAPALARDTLSGHSEAPRDEEHLFDGEMHSLRAPVAWLALQDYVREWTDDGGHLVFRGRYPDLAAAESQGFLVRRAVERERSAMAREYFVSEQRMRLDFNERREAAEYIGGYYSLTHTILAWGQVDGERLCYLLRLDSNEQGAHPYHYYRARNIDVKTGEELTIEDIVTSRDDLIAALARAFRKETPEREKYLYEMTFEEQLEKAHPAGKEFAPSCCFLILPNGDLKFYYAPYRLGPYAAGDFETTIRRSEEPGLFKAS